MAVRRVTAIARASLAVSLAATVASCARQPPSARSNIHLRHHAIGEIFDMLNSVNPSGFRARGVVPSTGAADPALLQPTTFSGDLHRPEQRLGQIGFRFTF